MDIRINRSKGKQKLHKTLYIRPRLTKAEKDIYINQFYRKGLLDKESSIFLKDFR